MGRWIPHIKIPTRLIIAALLLCIAAFLYSSTYLRDSNTIPAAIAAIRHSPNLAEQKVLYRALIARVGLSKAQEALYRSGLPFDGQAHLLNHISGEYAYAHYGSAGLSYCKDYFLGSCFHAVILDIIASEGLSGLSHISGCFSQGIPLSIQCAHGIGHGLLAYVGYKNLPEALTLCDTLKDAYEDFPLFNCHDGVFMENFWAVHDDGSPSPDRWISKSDPLFPCDSPAIQDAWQLGCWSNQPSVMFQFFKGDIQKVANECASLHDARYRSMCYDGLARQLHPMVAGNLEKAKMLCKEVGEGQAAACLRTISGADYAVGGRDLPFSICASLTGDDKRLCYEQLFDGIPLYYADRADQRAQCAYVRDAWFKDECATRY